MYKSAKVAFVSGTTGSSLAHVNELSLAALVSVALCAALTTRFPSRGRGLVSQWTLLVLPLLLSMTLFATAPLSLSLLLAAPTALLLSLPRRLLSSPLPSASPPSPHTPRFPFIHALTIYRAHMMLITVLAILAVDFPVFPRMLAKCESFGVSFMDLGVGSFVFSQGLVSAIPFISQPHYLLQPTIHKTLRKALPILALGLLRVVLVKSTDYPEHVTEYGVHWNFFLTLAILPILQVILHPILIRYPISLIGLLIAFFQQILLSLFNLQNYVLTSPRTTSLISSNKEGLISLIGYLSIHILGLSTGTLVLPYSPSFFRRQQKAFAKGGGNNNNKLERVETRYRQTDKTAVELVSYTIANLPYVLWIAAFNTSFFLGYLLLLDIFFFPHPRPSKKEKKTSLGVTDHNYNNNDDTSSFGLLNAINRHGLSVFLIANLMTGGINLMMKTMYVSDVWAMCILMGYSLVICGFAWNLEKFEKRRKK
ncbi:hypothetical protein AGABI1DRAFT_75828 [Agaricus bisporus var. burnettii JB137-S8]|uniref:GPI-anchored wall transfer protein n=1 Tax=Agaricus bisporus var. burnettii (strain JB137-S8 / ATCC MYA-4627 / FGSC 10392) TaxID=597362 RepID=K5WSB3_AGABU|nr:uncharacterized protein AGABI1DRAFT_75828 [Agaricus bisporus var. burnettii JB137-S8]EKM78301.1 hypothetical protein AGABI1DRAFT_75828 [Agaricus bisporus var. burnettii JB137-S8]